MYNPYKGDWNKKNRFYAKTKTSSTNRRKLIKRNNLKLTVTNC